MKGEEKKGKERGGARATSCGSSCGGGADRRSPHRRPRESVAAGGRFARGEHRGRLVQRNGAPRRETKGEVGREKRGRGLSGRALSVAHRALPPRSLMPPAPLFLSLVSLLASELRRPSPSSLPPCRQRSMGRRDRCKEAPSGARRAGAAERRPRFGRCDGDGGRGRADGAKRKREHGRRKGQRWIGAEREKKEKESELG